MAILAEFNEQMDTCIFCAGLVIGDLLGVELEWGGNAMLRKLASLPVSL